MFFQIHNETIVAPGASFDFPIHTHDSIEIMICTEGTLKVSCNNEERILKKDEIMIAFPNDIHSYSKTEFGKRIMIIIRSDFSEVVTSSLNSAYYSNFIKSNEAVSVAKKLVEVKKNQNALAIYGYIHILLGYILKKTDKKNYYNLSTFNRAIKYISQNYTRHITLKEVSNKTGVTQSHLSRIFSEKINGGFSKYLRILRVEKAKSLLKNTNMNIYEIMFESGFSDQSTFNRVFKSVTKMTPKEYKRLSQMG